jgi:predicted nucleic acid-binding protein
LYLIDTSVWIDYLRAKQTAAVEQLRSLAKAHADFGICPVILREILQGTRDDEQFAKYAAYFTTMPIYRFDSPVKSAVESARTYFDCRRRGITVRSSNDCLIAQLSLEHELVLLHDDRDFERIAEVRPRFQQTSG